MPYQSHCVAFPDPGPTCVLRYVLVHPQLAAVSLPTVSFSSQER